MKKKNILAAASVAMLGIMVFQTVGMSMSSVLAGNDDEARKVDEKIAYFVDCGDYDVTTVSEGDAFGVYNSVTDQVYGVDAITGKKWGIVDEVSEPIKNGSIENDIIKNAVFTDNTWPMEWVGKTDEAKTVTQRYTKNQFESGIDRNLHYAFELPNGEYEVEMYFVNPWNCSLNPKVDMEDETKIEAANVDTEEKAKVNVADGELNIDITAPSETLCINLAYIKVYMPVVEEDKDDVDKEENEEAVNVGIGQYDLSDIRITDEYLLNAEEKDINYLLSLDSDRLLAGFRETAGLSMEGKVRYEGWENSLIGGHTMGHYLTAMAQAVDTLPLTDGRREKVAEKLNYIVKELKECQDELGTGYIFGATLADKTNVYAQFDNVEKGKTNIGTEAWVPWYTMHKILAGLVDTYKFTGNEEALEVAKRKSRGFYCKY